MTEAEARIREALEKAPTHGEWVAYRTGGRPEVSHAIPPFIAACNPTNIAALLDELDHWRSDGLEQARLLGISGTTEFRLLTELDRLTRERDEIAARLESAVDALTHKRPLMTTAKTVDDWRRIAEHLDFEWSECSRHLNKVAAQRDEARAEREAFDALRAEVEALRAERDAMTNVLPGVYYMDPPDGGDVSLLKQLQRMSNDAARYRLLRRKFAIISDGEGNAEFCPINLPRPTYIAPNTAIELDTALDRERLGLDGTRPPTPVGWSDTDCIKRLQEQDEQPHPLAGQHINQGSMNAAADAYEAEYNAARGISEADKD